MPVLLIVRHHAASRNDSIAKPQWLPKSNSLFPLSADYASATETMKPPGLTAYVSSVDASLLSIYIMSSILSHYVAFYIRSSGIQSDWLPRLLSSINILSLILSFSLLR